MKIGFAIATHFKKANTPVVEVLEVFDSDVKDTREGSDLICTIVPQEDGTLRILSKYKVVTQDKSDEQFKTDLYIKFKTT